MGDYAMLTFPGDTIYGNGEKAYKMRTPISGNSRYRIDVESSLETSRVRANC